MNISLVIYCQHSHALSKIYDLVTTYGPFFGQCLIVLNIPKDIPIPPLYPQDLKRISILRMPDQIDAGAALTKIFSHLSFERCLVLDSRIQMKKEVLNLLRHWNDYEFESIPSIISFQTQPRHATWHAANRLGDYWKGTFRFATTVSWGAMLIDRQHILSLGGFDSRLSDEALMVDLSWRVQKSTGLLLESAQPLAILKDPYEPNPVEIRYLQQKYPELYPAWYKFFRKLMFWLKSSSANDKALN